ncbi:MAG: Hsp20/alpha crystallin family protein [Candidatus Methanomethylicia archaeon]|nr:Hsp20/alpha crystallin family protein [Candidatus Methanomethylicia archaeon]
MCNDEKRIEKDIRIVIGGLGFPFMKILKTECDEMGRYHIKDEGDKYIVTVELPGVRKEDIKLYVSEKMVSVYAKTSIKLPHGKEEYRYKVKLEEIVEVENVKAKYFEGLLTIELPKKKIGREVKIE